MQTIRIENTSIRTGDGCQLATTVFHPHNTNGQVVIFNAAMATPQEYYSRFAQFLSGKGYTCLTYDYRGIGQSREQAISPKAMRLRDWGEQDFEAVLNYVKAQLHPRRLIVFGHSCGGQITGLAPSALAIDAFVFTTVQSGYWRHWPSWHKYKMAVLWHIAMPALSMGSYFPAKAVGFSSVDVPSGIINSWCAWGRRSGYIFDPHHGHDLSRYAKLDVPILAYGFNDDTYAPPAAIDALLPHFSAADITRRQIKPSDLGIKHIGHFGFYREKFKESLWQETLDWLQAI